MTTTTAAAPAVVREWTLRNGEFKGNKTLTVYRNFFNRDGSVAEERLFSAGPVKWAQLFGRDSTGELILAAGLNFLNDNSPDFASVMNDVDAFVMAYLEFRQEHLGSNDDLLGRTSSEEQVSEEEVVDPIQLILESEALRSLSGGKELPPAFVWGVVADFEASNVGVEQYLGGMAEYAQDGSTLCDYLAESWTPDAEGRPQPYQTARGAYRKACAAWSSLWDCLTSTKPEEQEESPPVEQPSLAASKVDLANARKLLSSQLGRLWTTATRAEQEWLVEDCANCMKGGVSWVDYRDGLKTFKKASEYFQHVG